MMGQDTHDQQSVCSTPAVPRTLQCASGLAPVSLFHTIGRRGLPAAAVGLLLLSGSCANAAASPTIVLAPLRLDFGQVTLTGFAESGFVVANFGPGDLVITAVGITGANAAEFSVSSFPCRGTAIQSGHTCYIGVDFRPTEAGEKSASVMISDNAPDSPQTLPLTATVPPDLVPESIAIRDHGGPIIQHPQVESIYLGSFWQQQDARKLADYCDAFSRTVVGSAYLQGLAEYGVGAGSFVRSVTVATAKLPSQVTDEQLVNELTSRISDGELPWPDPQIVSWPNSQTLFFLFTPPGVVVHVGSIDTLHDLGAYHGYSTGRNFAYAVIPWPDGRPVPFVAPSASDFHGSIPPPWMAYWMMTPLISHELAEACTDPQHGAWYDDGTRQEIADLPMSLAAAGRVSYNDVYQWLPGANGSQYLVQKYWSQSTRSILSMGN